MSRIAKRFEQLATSHRTALIPYITGGDPAPEITVPLLHALVDAGADLLEIGVPFSDPMADGPVIQAACERALKHHTSLKDIFAMVKQFREQDRETPVILMGYLNPIEVMGYADFARLANEAGVDGVLTVDLPPEEAEDLVKQLKLVQLDAIFLAAPTSDEDRLRAMDKLGGGFLYYVSFKGVTGASQLDVSAVENKLKMIRQVSRLPVGVGFGIRDPQSAAQVAQVADAVVVGSVLVKKIAELEQSPEKIPGEVAGILSGMRQAMDNNG
ncbi:MAG: tryptophan synthase subunit alpha [Gammaproteobacteria bacterium]